MGAWEGAARVKRADGGKDLGAGGKGHRAGGEDLGARGEDLGAGSEDLGARGTSALEARTSELRARTSALDLFGPMINEIQRIGHAPRKPRLGRRPGMASGGRLLAVRQ
jgi:hypothetical protein